MGERRVERRTTEGMKRGGRVVGKEKMGMTATLRDN
jgi:hypothetical protein